MKTKNQKAKFGKVVMMSALFFGAFAIASCEGGSDEETTDNPVDTDTVEVIDEPIDTHTTAPIEDTLEITEDVIDEAIETDVTE